MNQQTQAQPVNTVSFYDFWTIFQHSPHGEWGTYHTTGQIFLFPAQRSQTSWSFNHQFTALSTQLSVSASQMLPQH